MKNRSDTGAHLIMGGWKVFHDPVGLNRRAFYKKFDTPTRCRANNDRPGKQVELYVSEFDGSERCEIEVAGELADGTWVKIHQWALPDEIDDCLALIPRMLSTWEHIANSHSENKEEKDATCI